MNEQRIDFLAQSLNVITPRQETERDCIDIFLSVLLQWPNAVMTEIMTQGRYILKSPNLIIPAKYKEHRAQN